MKKLFLLFAPIAIISFFSCKKDDIPKTDDFAGIWVEKTQQLDTLDFDEWRTMVQSEPIAMLRCQPFIDSVTNPTFVISREFYWYKAEGTNLLLRNGLSSTMTYTTYPIVFSADRRTFSIDRFYKRRSLANRIEFVRIR
ncbi:MAG: hypothetical protein V4722_22555 [Bacteroidota bacterium]